MYVLSLFSSFYGECFENRVLLLLVAWIVWPGLMFLVGVVFESRTVPIGGGQSKAFFPGDLSLGVGLVAMIGMYEKTGVNTVPLVDTLYWWLPLMGLIGLGALKLRQNEAPNYSRNAFVSPTKITHDIMGYFLFPFLLLGLGIPQLVMLREDGVFEATRTSWFVVAMAVVFYLACFALDLLTFYDRRDISSRHPDYWQPIWRKNNRRR